MVSYGITETGFNQKTIDVIEDEFKELLKQFFGSSVDVSQLSPLWKMIQVPATEITHMWTLTEYMFYNLFINTAEKSSLDLLAEDIGLKRKDAISASVELTIYKNTDNAVIVPKDSMFETAEGIQFKTIEEIEIATGDKTTTTGTVDAIAVIAGITGNVGVGTILYPSSTISGVDSCYNSYAADGGEEKETDVALRKRIRAYVRAVWTEPAIRSAALNVEGVEGVKIIEYATSYDCLIVPKTVFTNELKTNVEDAIEKVTCITVEYTVLEAESVGIKITANISITTTYDEISAEQDAEVEIREYLQGLGIDDDVFKARVIQAIMETVGIENVSNVVLVGKPVNEKHRYLTASGYTYNLNYSTGIDSVEVVVKGTIGGTPDQTFVKGTDYNFSVSPAQIIFTGTGNLPDNDTDFYVTYTFPANAIGDIEINQNNIAVFDSVDFTVI